MCQDGTRTALTLYASGTYSLSMLASRLGTSEERAKSVARQYGITHN